MNTLLLLLCFLPFALLLLLFCWIFPRSERRMKEQQRKCEQSLADGMMIANGQIPPRYQPWVDHYKTLQTDEERLASLERFLNEEEVW